MNRMLQTAMGVTLLAAVAMGCTVGSGSGEAAGPMYIANCAGYGGLISEPVLFDLDPKFFAAEGVEDIREGDKLNRLAIRIQRFGGNIESTDVLLFDIVNSYEVARCVRGRTFLTFQGEVAPDYDANVCWWPTPAGPPRMRVGPNDYVRASLLPFGSCRSDNAPLVVVGTAIGCANERTDRPCPPVAQEKWPSWIEFETFGSVRREMGSPDQRSPVGRGFKVNFNERIWASKFSLTLADDLLIQPNVTPSVRDPRIGGRMEGWFDFDFERGRAVQTFP